eukprot:TRINITY_DN19917_c0_g1_i1.p1 TRINITY_DN19917_c0_g1~~TRINITY_DN19917_c0_g1_i1.p1  ORF type:complete len:189 (-),score=22.72 TRINITY_DN19917_c0_g1_i1:170-736(-)
MATGASRPTPRPSCAPHLAAHPVGHSSRASRRNEVHASRGKNAASVQRQQLAEQKDDVTVMLKNIPNKTTREKLVEILDAGESRGQYDFLYLPIDFRHKCNKGFCFINFRSSDACRLFSSKFHGQPARRYISLDSEKVFEVCPARVQGFRQNIKDIRKGKVMKELVRHPEWLPLLFDARGKPMEFPMP